MTALPLRSAMKVAASHAAKQAVELVEAVSIIGEHLKDDMQVRREIETTYARGNIAAIRRELDDLDRLLAATEAAAEPVPLVAA